jgi:hypothetical protein
VPAQEPQSMHFEASITLLASFSEIAATGQAPSQAPQFTQTSGLILYAILKTPPFLYFLYYTKIGAD